MLRFLVVMLLIGEVFAEGSRDDRPIYYGLKKIQFLVEGVGEELQREGVDRAEVTAIALKRLQLTGLEVLTEQKEKDAPTLKLHLMATAVKMAGAKEPIGYAVAYRLDLTEMASLLRRPSMGLQVGTWTRHGLITAPAGMVRRALKNNLWGVIDAFAVEYEKGAR